MLGARAPGTNRRDLEMTRPSDPRRLISFRYDRPLDHLTEQAVAALIQMLPVGEEGMQFDGAHATGTIVNHRYPQVWSVSFRPSPGGSGKRDYHTVTEAARTVITGTH